MNLHNLPSAFTIQTMKRPTLSIVIPCLNEKQTISQAVKDVKKYAKKHFKNDFEVIVADNGSTDGSLEILKKTEGIKLVEVPVRGYGAALHWGIMKAKGEYVLFADADLSYPFLNIYRFKNEIKKGKADLILGSRMTGKIEKDAMPFLHRYLGTPILTYLIRVLYRIPTTDCNSGMRVVKRRFYKTLNMRNSGMEWASELLLKTAVRKGEYKEVPIRFAKDKRGKAPHLSTWSDGWRHLKAIILLKPSTLYPFLIIFPLLSLFFYRISFALTFLFAELAVVLLLSLLSLELLGSIIEERTSRISRYLLKFRLVPTTGLFALLVGLSIFLIPEAHLGTKLFLISIIGILFMWIFLIETIKTHLANRLPDV